MIHIRFYKSLPRRNRPSARAELRNARVMHSRISGSHERWRSEICSGVIDSFRKLPPFNVWKERR